MRSIYLIKKLTRTDVEFKYEWFNFTLTMNKFDNNKNND